MRFEIVFEHETRGEELDEAGGVEVDALLDEHITPNDVAVGDHPTEAHARRQDLASRFPRYTTVHACQGGDRWQRFTLETELGV